MRQFNVLQPDTPAPYSPVLLKEWLPNADDVIKAVKKVMYK
jgi:pyruvate dehydrogenase E1 component beta subunit